jgi:hypothetical protein
MAMAQQEIIVKRYRKDAVMAKFLAQGQMRE